MKLRTNKNSLRLRLSQKEVASFQQYGSIEECVNFSDQNSDCLRYSLIQADHEQISVTFINNHIRVYVPLAIASKWFADDQIGFDARILLKGEDYLYVLVEKDYQCLVDRPNEDESNNFPNPNAAKC
ncbi:MAG: hypothetical protein IPK91_03070 [Saprospiraceae bacterium]|jgi:hypothetical protein|nr:hypothetical protein [Saprospiraceae bacterium]MBK8296269.1 hypothetical protein [Saprospiraceae bacterium]